MTEATKQERDPILDKVVTLEFTVDQVNGILNLIGSEITFVKAMGLINEIQAQVAPQLRVENESEKTS